MINQLKENLDSIKNKLPKNVILIAVSKYQALEKINIVYNLGQRIFGENRVQDLMERYEALPKDIEWHLIGHLQRNKVKYIAPFISLIHSVDSLELLEEINKQAIKNNRKIDCLLQVHVAQEDTKFGFSQEVLNVFLASFQPSLFPNINIKGLMGMATNTENISQIKNEFKQLKTIFDTIKSSQNFVDFQILSMGMSSDYELAIEEGSTMIRVGSAIFN